MDVLSYRLIPEMSVLDESEKKKVLKKYSISESQFPRMYCTDPVAVALKAEAGDVIKVKRESITGKHTEYRVVIEQ